MMVEVERDLRRSSGPTSLLKQGHLEQVTEDHVQTTYKEECFYSVSGETV